MTDRDTSPCYDEERIAFETKLAIQSAKGLLGYVDEFDQRFDGGMLSLSPDERKQALGRLNAYLKFEFQQSESGLYSGVNLMFSGIGAYREFDYLGKAKEGHTLIGHERLYGNVFDVGAIVVPKDPYVFAEGSAVSVHETVVSPVVLLKWPFASNGVTLESLKEIPKSFVVVPLVYEGMEMQVTD